MHAVPRLWRIRVNTSREAEEAVSVFLEEWFSQPATSFLDVETRNATVTVYVTEKPTGSVRQLRQTLLKNLSSAQLASGSLSVSCAKLRKQDWAESWKRHFRPVSIGRALLLKPSWSRKRPLKGQATVILDPGLSFGTGQHPTTAFCLQQLVGRRRTGKTQSFLDVGTGSGILAIAAAKLGYGPVEAFDFDPESIRVAKANGQVNRVFGRFQLYRSDITRMPRRSRKQYEMICANLLADLLLKVRDKLLARLSPGGVLVLAGILEKEFPRVQAAFEAAGLHLLSAKTKNEWRSGAFSWRQHPVGYKSSGA
jgi:ribosomal protein L11 methyltransferase